MNKFLAFKASMGLAIVGLSLLPKANAEASTFAGSFVEVDIFNFNTDLLLLSNDTTAFTDALAAGDSVANFNDAASLFEVDPIRIRNFTEGTSEGNGDNFLGNTNGTASATGIFFVEEEFSFDFTAQLDVLAEVDRPTQEASALANLSFSVFTSETLAGPATLADSFTLAGFVSSISTEDGLILDNGPNITLTPFSCPSDGNSTCIDQSLGGLSEFVTASVNGKFQQTFEQPTFVALVENKLSATQVRVVEPTSGWFLLALGGMAIATRRKLKGLSNRLETVASRPHSS